MVQSHPEEVRVLLWNPKTAEHAMAMLRDEARDLAPDTAVALARELLNAGKRMDKNEPNWPDAVRDLLRQREDASATYWRVKAKKFEPKPAKGLQRAFRERLPFYSFSEAKSVQNFNGKLGQEGQKYVCAHLAEAVKDDPKTFLKRISLQDVSWLNHARLRERRRELRHVRGRRTVPFTPENFGRLLVRVAGLVRPDETRSFAVYYVTAIRDAHGHGMRVFLKKGFSSTSPRQLGEHAMDLKVSFYDPNVTGDMKHLRVWPEDLETMPLEVFTDDRTSKVLGLALDDDEELAQALGDQFIASETNNKNTYLQIGRYLNALASGNLPDMRRAEAMVWQGRGFKSLNSRAAQLAEALSFALQDAHAEEIRELARSRPLLELLETGTLEMLVRAKTVKGWPGLHNALSRGHAEAVLAFEELLAQVAHRLEKKALADAILDAVTGTTGLGGAMLRGHHKAVQAFGQLILRFQKELGEAVVERILFAHDKRVVHGLQSALQSNQGAAIRAYGEVVQAVALRPSTRAALLMEPMGLASAIDQGHGEAVLAYLDVVIAFQPQLEDRGWSLWTQVHRVCMKRFYCLPFIWVKRPVYQALLTKHPEVQAKIDQMRRQLKP